MTTDLFEVVMPQMGESVTEGTITAWRKKVGDAVEEGEALLDISTAKVEVEIPSPKTGILARILVNEGDTVPVDTVIASIAPAGADLSDLPAAAATARPAAPAAQPARQDGRGNGASAPHAAPAENAEDLEAERQHLLRRRSTPLVRNIARELDIDLSRVEGTGINGRVTKRDVEEYIAAQKAPADPLPTEPAAKKGPQTYRQRPGSPKDGAIRLDTVLGPEQDAVFLPPEEIKVSVMRRSIAEQMVRSVNNIPLAYTAHEVDFTHLEKIRVRAKPLFENHLGTKLTPLVFAVRAVTDALLAHPSINASWAGDRIILHKNVNIGIAVAVREGLVVPVLKCVEAMTLGGIARGLVDLATRARTGKLLPADMEGATFTVTSTGQLGAAFAIPIVNQPQGAILHFGAIRKLPVVVTGPDGEDTIAIRQRAFLTLGIDHRLIDGWAADKFMINIKERIERADFGLPV